MLIKQANYLDKQKRRFTILNSVNFSASFINRLFFKSVQMWSLVLLLLMNTVLSANTTQKFIIKVNRHHINNISEFANQLSQLGITDIQKVDLSENPKKKNQNQPLNFSSNEDTNRDNKVTLLAHTSLSIDENHPIITALNDDHFIDYIEPVYPITLFSAPNDPLYPNQEYMDNLALYKLLNLPINKTVIIAVVDSGVDYFHEDLRHSVYTNINEVPNNGRDDDNNGYIDDVHGYNFRGVSNGKGSNDSDDQHGHGTHIASIIAAKTNNRIGIAGMSNGIKILPIRFLDSQGKGNQIDAAAAIRYAVDQGADIINCSWGFFKINTALKEAIEYALNRGVIVVAAAGNSDSYIPEYPAKLAGVITIGAASKSGQKSHFSSYGNHVDFLFRGQHIFGATPGNSYEYKSGTSQSTAFVSGIIGALLSVQPSLKKEEVYQILQESTQQETKSDNIGYGQINIKPLLSLINFDTPSVISELSPDLKLIEVYNYPNPIRSNKTQFKVDSTKSQVDIKIQIFTPAGELVETIYSKKDTDIPWTIGPNIKNGTYIYYVQVTDELGNTKSKIEKCTVMR